MSSTKNIKSPRHPFHFEVDIGGKTRVVTSWAKVKRGKKVVQLTLTTEHVREAIKNRRSVGNGMQCLGYLCSVSHGVVFPHPVVEGYVDFGPSRAYVVSKVGKDGMPSECVAYEHSVGESVVKPNDTPGGQLKLLAKLEKDGPMLINLRPSPVHKSSYRSRVRGKDDGSRTRIQKGALRRLGMAELGLSLAKR